MAGVKYTGSTADTSGKGATRIPNFELVSWNKVDAQEPTPEPEAKQSPLAEDDEPLF